MQTPESEEKRVVSRVCASKQFPGKLHDLLTYAESSGLEWIISWVNQGKAFMVHNQQHLLQILPIFFGQTKFRSFRRQLNMWHFERVLVGPFKGAFMHPCFQRGNRALCGAMSRHHLPSAEMYEQAFAFSNKDNVSPSSYRQTASQISQFILNEKPNQLVMNRLSPNLDPDTLKWAEGGQHQDLIKSTELADGCDNKPRARDNKTCTIACIDVISKQSSCTLETPPTREQSFINNRLQQDEEEDWSLFSDCLKKVIYGEIPPRTEYSLEGHYTQASSIKDNRNKYVPVDAIAPGMETPATPETIEMLFAHFDDL
ncbi:HSF-type DNA-binding protein [Nitzschia inconspicua]|uniref:HSF-type DNA-binding protein n=1 Tax=Nitzschia inconspicua TaxID=303405 RepID=A0A9K3M5Y3_9STRA|nr:HSF-type DNA-binding protein [Nitzschia inconspicua]